MFNCRVAECSLRCFYPSKPVMATYLEHLRVLWSAAASWKAWLVGDPGGGGLECCCADVFIVSYLCSVYPTKVFNLAFVGETVLTIPPLYSRHFPAPVYFLPTPHISELIISPPSLHRLLLFPPPDVLSFVQRAGGAVFRLPAKLMSKCHLHAT